MIGHRPISTSQHHPGAQRRQLRTGAIEAEQGQRGHGGTKPGKGMNLATSPQNECENRRRRPSRGLAHTPGTPIFALFRWTSERAASIRCPDGGSGQGSFASFLKELPYKFEAKGFWPPGCTGRVRNNMDSACTILRGPPTGAFETVLGKPL